ncbi:MAG TPA: PAS domain S-box protein, partial [Chthoniobacteraceae bacterium]|nr:PAS domain S-box protein [Chthoniobacteraceae bacterium]
MSKPPCTISIDFDRLDALLRRALVFNHIDDAMIVTTLEGIIVDWNIGAERICGWRREQALNATFEIFLAPNAPKLIRQIIDTVA